MVRSSNTTFNYYDSNDLLKIQLSYYFADLSYLYMNKVALTDYFSPLILIFGYKFNKSKIKALKEKHFYRKGMTLVILV